MHTQCIYVLLVLCFVQFFYYGNTYSRYYIQGTAARQEHLREGKYFQCHCARCNDPTEFGTHFSSLLCQHCCTSTALIRPIFVNSTTTNWQCNCCESPCNSTDVQEILSNARADVVAADMDIVKLETFLQKYSPILCGNHYLMLEVKQKLAAILRSICEQPQSSMQQLMAAPKAGEAVVRRKMELCRDIVDVLRVLQPGISRMLGKI